MEKLIIQKSTHPHTLEVKGDIVSEEYKGALLIKTGSNGIVTHGEHGTLKTESENIIKYTQQELNPVTKMLQDAFD